ncbi:MlaE family ABC transporter permease [Desulfogranum mediterraneum]|uniref:MlaE family ABC transporter permease n=1 Tax=Desulfogranum mediterraneum TaxID=160661 RepID=UPI00041DCA60|nr:ABC transporter permease [Desulfogranum mediterraneum]
MTRVGFNCDQLQDWDSLLPVMLQQLEACCRSRSIALDPGQLPHGVQQLLRLAQSTPVHLPPQPSAISPVGRLGRFTLETVARGRELATFSGEIILECGALSRGQTTFRLRDFWSFVQAAGAEALPIVSLISILVGVILAFVGAVQLQMFGAQVYVANLVGLAMVLEMGAMMSGVIMAGRTGASYAAQLGTMQVNEEIDALRTLGISPIGFLVLPRMFALILMMPLLCIYADLLGIIGGSLVGVFMLDLSVSEYFSYTRRAIHLNQCLEGIIKSTVYGLLVGFAGCFRGLQCGRSSAAVGEATTSAVVTAIVLIIISDALMTFIFNLLKMG